MATDADGVRHGTHRAADSAAGALLARVTDHVMEHGLVDTSMRRIAAAAGVSHQLLGYHFGTLDGLLGEILYELRRRESLRLLSSVRTRRDSLEAVWTYYTSPERRLEMRLFFYLVGKASLEPGRHEGFVDSIVSAWADQLARLGEQEGAEPGLAAVEARVLVDVFRGILQDYLVTGDERGTSQAYELALDRLLPANGRIVAENVEPVG
jgi:AcrR family transcriptional regulator